MDSTETSCFEYILNVCTVQSAWLSSWPSSFRTVSTLPAWVVDQLLLRPAEMSLTVMTILRHPVLRYLLSLRWGSCLSLRKVHGSYSDSKFNFELIIYNIMGVAHPSWPCFM